MFCLCDYELVYAGSISLSGEDYVVAVKAFIESLTLDMTGSEALRLSYSITSVSTTLTEEQVTVTLFGCEFQLIECCFR